MLYENLDKMTLDQYDPEHPSHGPYDFASAMHYSRRTTSSSNGGNLFSTIPPGLRIPSGMLSAGDIDGVARLYRRSPEETTINSNPPGLAVIVDGVRLNTPTKFRWSTGTTHVIEAPVFQIVDGVRYLFGRWNHGGPRVHNFTADPDATWMEANFIQQYRVRTDFEPQGSGRVTLSPPSPDGFYTLGTKLQAVATPVATDRYQFLRWKDSFSVQHGWASNPASWRVDGPDKSFKAVFSRRPVLRVEANADPFLLYISGYYQGKTTWTLHGPAVFPVDVSQTRISVGVDRVHNALGRGAERLRFEGWSNGKSSTHSVRLPRTNTTLTARFSREYPLSTSVSASEAGRVSVYPTPDDRYSREGTLVHLNAQPSPPWEFVQWTGDFDGQDPSATIEMDRPKHVEAVFARSHKIKHGSPQNVRLPATNYRFYVYDQEDGFRLDVPDDATELTISFVSSSKSAEVGLLVTTDSRRLRWSYREDGRTPEFHAEFQSTSTNGYQSILITPDSRPALDLGSIYHIGFVVFSPRTEIRGTLRATVRRGAPMPSADTSPRALAFVSSASVDPPPQTFRLVNNGKGVLQYAIGANHEWISVSPASGSLLPATSSRIDVKVRSAGLPADSHQGELSIVSNVRDTQKTMELATVPVVLAVVQSPVASGSATGDPNLGDGRETAPRLLRKVEPEYSEEARQARLQGTVMLSAEIWEDGRAHNFRVQRSLGLGLDERAIEAVKQWRFSPGVKYGKPVRVAVRFEVRFWFLVVEARKKLMEIRERIVAVLEVFDTEWQRDTQVGRQWGTGSLHNSKTNVKGVLESVFGLGKYTKRAPDDDRALQAIDDLIRSLETAEALKEALRDDKVLKGLAAVDMAERIFAMTAAESTMTW